MNSFPWQRLFLPYLNITLARRFAHATDVLLNVDPFPAGTCHPMISSVSVLYAQLYLILSVEISF